MIERLKKILLSIRLFSALVLRLPLRPYQAGPANAVIGSCLTHSGIEFLWIFPRQSGKDEAVAQLVVYLLTLFHRVEASIVHVYPTVGQLATGTTRLENRLDNPWTKGRWWRKSKPLRRGLGKAQITFFSGNPQAKAEGATANLLLIINEVQDCVETIIDRRFTPMRASTNATCLYVGTVRTTSDYLYKVKQRLERLQAEDGLQRVFVVSPDQVGAENPHYRTFVAEQIRSKGRNHPAIKTELFNEPVDVAAKLFPERRRALMRGQHRRQDMPVQGELYLALVDVGGQDEAATSAFAELDKPGRDYTVCTIVRVVKGLKVRRFEGSQIEEPSNLRAEGPLWATFQPSNPVGPAYEAVTVFAWQGIRHFQDMPGAPSLFSRLLGVLRIWQPQAVICDSTGVGQGIYDALVTGYKRAVFGFDFGGGRKARLGNDFLAVVETGRFRYFHEREADDDVLSDEQFFFLQCEFCGYELAEGMPIERGLRWGVSSSARYQAPDGQVLLVHDDRLLSAALVAEADRLYREGELFLSTGESVVIPRDIMSDIDRGAW